MITQAEGRGRRPPHGGRGRSRGDSGGRGRTHRVPVSDGEGRGHFGQHWPEPAGQVGQPMLSEGHPPGFAVDSGAPQQGVVVALLDSYGFIRPPGGQSQIFFHGSEIQNIDKPSDEQFDLRQLLQLGDEVSFDIKHIAHKHKKINAVNVNKLPKGTIAALQSADRGRYRGTIQVLPGESSWRSQDITPGKIVFTKPSLSSEPGSDHVALYKPADLQNKALKLHVGDKVEFTLVQQQQQQEQSSASLQDLATSITLVSRAASGEESQLQGCVISVKEGFGFIRPASKPNDRVYFRLGDVVGPQGGQGLQAHSLALNSEVSFVMVPDPRGHQDRAANVQVLDVPFDPRHLSMLTGMRQGRVIKSPAAAPSEQLLDGVLVYNDDQTTFNCSFGAFQIRGGASLEEDDEVSFEAGVNVATGARKATSVQLLSKANDTAVRRELGQIITMRTQFGFIKCCERPGEMFFHFSALKDGPEAFAVGDDVEFSVTREPKGERLNAVEITKAAQGSAVFETVSEERYVGRVVDRVVPPRGYNAASTSGLLSCEMAGEQQQLPFGLADLEDSSLNPGAGEKVSFRLATHLATAKAAQKAAAPNSKYAGRRAVQVMPVHQEGLVVSISEAIGLVEFTQDEPYLAENRDDKQRIPFQVSEVQNEVQLKPSDIVQFVLHLDSRSKERQAARVSRLKVGDGFVPQEAQRKNPNAIKFTGGSAEGIAKAKINQAARIARGPDGTRGFTATLQPGGRARLLPPPNPTPDPPTTPSAPGSAGSQQVATPNGLHTRTDSASPSPGVHSNGAGKGRGQAGRAAGRGRTANSPSSGAPASVMQILQPPRQQSASPVLRGTSSGPNSSSAPVPITAHRKQKPSSSSSQDLRKQAVMSQAARQQPQQAADAQQSLSTAQPGTTRDVPDQGVVNGQLAGVASPSDVKDGTSNASSAAPQRTDSGRMLNPFASTFVPRTSSGTLLSPANELQ